MAGYRHGSRSKDLRPPPEREVPGRGGGNEPGGDRLEPESASALVGAGGVHEVGSRGQGPVVGAGPDHLVVGAAGGLEPVVASAQGREVARTGHSAVGVGLDVVPWAIPS